MKILLSGAAGQLGRAIHRLYGDEAQLILTEAPAIAASCAMRPLDITDTDAVLSAVREEKPDLIINCAAYTAVDKQEEDEDLSYRINAIGPRNLAIAAEETQKPLVHVSTDYVFDGRADRPYTEFDPVSPESVYGKTKLAGERFVQGFSRRYFILRTAWLYGEGHNFVKTMLKLSATHDTVSVVDDQIGTPTSADELARAIRFLAGTDNYGLFHATCEGSCSWADFAREIFRLGKKDVQVTRVSTADYLRDHPQSAKRPAYSVLDNYMLRLTSAHRFAEWQDAIAAYFGTYKDMI